MGPTRRRREKAAMKKKNRRQVRVRLVLTQNAADRGVQTQRVPVGTVGTPLGQDAGTGRFQRTVR